MDDIKDDRLDELREAYEADKERRNVREDELQAAKDYLGVLLKEIEEKNKELEEKQEEADKLADALKKSEDEKEEEANATKEAVESGRYKSIWIGIAIIEFLAIIAVVVSLFIVYNELKKDYEIQLADARGENGDVTGDVTETVTPAPSTVKIKEDLETLASSISSKLADGFTCTVENIDGLEYLVFSKDNVRVCYKNEYYVSETGFRNAVIIEKGKKRVYDELKYSFDEKPELLCPTVCMMNGAEVLLLTDYSGFGNIPEMFRLIDPNTLTVYYGDDLKSTIGSLMNITFPEETTGLSYAPILMELTTTRATYRYGLDDAGFNEIGYSTDTSSENEIADINSEFMLEFGEQGITWKTSVKLGRNFYLGELKGNLSLGAGRVLVSNAAFGAYVPANIDDEDLNGIIIPSKSVPERYVSIDGPESQRHYIAINDKVTECSYDWDRLDTSDEFNWIYTDENGEKVSYRGIDVSKYQGVIDWNQVASAGIEFAIIRMGSRGSREGTLDMDPYFTVNMQGAADAGIKTGVYFFSQAITEKEAEEEANFVIGAISMYDVTYPVIIDTEKYGENARANNLSYKERTDICIAFCEKVAKQGYTPMIYANREFMIKRLDLERLEKYDLWYAGWGLNSATALPYNFEMLQYSSKGSVPGIKGDVDLDISFVDYSALNKKDKTTETE